MYMYKYCIFSPRSLLSDELKVAEFAHQLVAMAVYYKFDGWLVNIENNIHVSVIVYCLQWWHVYVLGFLYLCL